MENGASFTATPIVSRRSTSPRRGSSRPSASRARAGSARLPGAELFQPPRITTGRTTRGSAPPRARPLVKRKAMLQKELRRTERIVYCQHVGESGEKLFQAADQLGIGKKADSPYR